MADIEQPELRAYDEPRVDGGNVRPADGRYLDKATKAKQTRYVAKVEEAATKDAERDAPQDDPLAQVLADAVANVLTAPDNTSPEEDTDA